jgi:hypothetical protein
MVALPSHFSKDSCQITPMFLTLSKDALAQPFAEMTGGPFKPGFGLSGQFQKLGKVLPLLGRISCRPFQLDLDSSPRQGKTQGPSTPQIMALR